MSDAGPTESARVDPALPPLEGGNLVSEITNRIVALMRGHYRPGPIKTKTYILDNLSVFVLTDGLTAVERTTMEGAARPNECSRCAATSGGWWKSLGKMIEALTGRKLLAFLSQVHVEPDLTIGMFVGTGRSASRLRRGRAHPPRPSVTAPAAFPRRAP
jgi:uncharacterized protein YbcI